MWPAHRDGSGQGAQVLFLFPACGGEGRLILRLCRRAESPKLLSPTPLSQVGEGLKSPQPLSPTGLPAVATIGRGARALLLSPACGGEVGREGFCPASKFLPSGSRSRSKAPLPNPSPQPLSRERARGSRSKAPLPNPSPASGRGAQAKAPLPNPSLPRDFLRSPQLGEGRKSER